MASMVGGARQEGAPPSRRRFFFIHAVNSGSSTAYWSYPYSAAPVGRDRSANGVALALST